VYNAQTLIGKGVSLQWKLSAINSIEMNSTALLQKELDKLMNLHIDNGEIREILVQHRLKGTLIKRLLQLQQEQLVLQK
jgi:hypothetical protein